MTNETNELLNNLITSINLESSDDLIDCFKKNLQTFKYDIPGMINSIDPKRFWDAGNIIRELQTRVELLLKLSDFLDYVFVLQGTLINNE